LQAVNSGEKTGEINQKGSMEKEQNWSLCIDIQKTMMYYFNISNSA
jgi:hypothetical protein